MRIGIVIYMLKLLIKIVDNEIIFDEYTKQINNININNTNVFNNNLTVFDENYILKNIELVSSFIKVIVMKNKVNKASINNIKISSLALHIINKLNQINILIIKPDKTLDFESYELLKKNKYLKYLNCYNMPKFMFEELNSKKKFTVDIRSEIIWFSNFMEINKLNTYSNIFYKRKIKIIDNLNEDDINDLDIFFKINNNLKQIDIYHFSKKNIEKICELIKENRIINIRINIYQNDTNLELINNAINNLKIIQNKLLKKQNIGIKIIYSDEYKQKNIFKQINISFLKVLAIIVIAIASTGYVAAKYINSKDSEKVKQITEEIKEEKPEEKIEEVNTEIVENETEKSIQLREDFSELLAINNETVGWIKVNNTKVDYPVVKHSDNNYYLNKDFYHNNNVNGWIYMDYRNNIDNLSDNTILYGHTNYSDYNLMFGSLINTIKEAWYTNEANTYITFNTLNANHQFKIFSIYVIDNTNDYLVSDFKSDVNHENFINTLISRSIYNFNTPVSINDKILTLSTCYDKGSKRLVIHAKLIS